METIKTALVVILLLAVLGGVYVVLNEPNGTLPQSLLDQAWTSADDTSEDDSGPEVSFAPAGGDSNPQEPGSHANTMMASPAAASASPASGAVARLSPPPLADSHDAPNSMNASLEMPAAPGSASARLSDLPNYGRGASGLATASFNAPGAGEVAGAADSQHLASHDGHSHDHGSMPEEARGPSNAMGANSVGESSASALTQYSFLRVWNTSQTQVDEGHMAEALLTLSTYYQSSALEESQTKRLMQRLDQLAGSVIYSRENRLEPAYKVRRGETLYEIAERYGVPWRLLRSINGVQDPELLLPGQELKVLRGPFRAEIDLQKSELTLFLGQLYAGRFPLSVGDRPAPRPGRFTVLALEPGRVFFDPSGRNLPVGHPDNPYGNVWIDLGGGLSLHGSSASAASSAGCLSLSPHDASDIFGILAQGSRVDIR